MDSLYQFTLRHQGNLERNLARSPCLLGVQILLVDDSVENILLFNRVLKKEGANTDGAENGLVAIEKQKHQKYDVIIMDVRMPIMDGYEATRTIRLNGYLGPIIALTAHAVPGEKERCMAAGCSAFYSKPIDRQNLLRAILFSLGKF